jgi:DNA-damage-inducible protein J
MTMMQHNETTRTAIVRARVRPKVKAGAQEILDDLGLSISEAINLLLVQITVQKALPFLVEMPNKKTRMLLDKCEQGKGMRKCKGLKDFYEQLGL